MPTCCALHGCCWALQGYSAVGHGRDILGIAEIFCGWALLGYSFAGYCRDAPPLVGQCKFCGWVLVGQCWDSQRLGTASILRAAPGFSAVGRYGIFCDWEQQGYSAVGHHWDFPLLSTAGKLCVGDCQDDTLDILGGALQGYCALEHTMQGYSAVGYGTVGRCTEVLQNIHFSKLTSPL